MAFYAPTHHLNWSVIAYNDQLWLFRQVVTVHNIKLSSPTKCIIKSFWQGCPILLLELMVVRSPHMTTIITYFLRLEIVIEDPFLVFRNYLIQKFCFLYFDNWTSYITQRSETFKSWSKLNFSTFYPMFIYGYFLINK